MQNSGNTILIVDDTETNIDILVELLGDEYDILVALDGKSALEIASEEIVDLILLDIMMPKMSGFEVCEELKKDDKTRDIPVIFITAKSDDDSIDEAYKIGGIDYVLKPFRPRELRVRVKTQLRLKALSSFFESAQGKM
ncbi:MAG TPA: response regulator [Campylobacterales bacterium]|nr:response regulator [Campylobacterales bacterium]